MGRGEDGLGFGGKWEWGWWGTVPLGTVLFGIVLVTSAIGDGSLWHYLVTLGTHL
jgi:hypothetical protein